MIPEEYLTLSRESTYTVEKAACGIDIVDLDVSAQCPPAQFDMNDRTILTVEWV